MYFFIKPYSKLKYNKDQKIVDKKDFSQNQLQTFQLQLEDLLVRVYLDSSLFSQPSDNSAFLPVKSSHRSTMTSQYFGSSSIK